MRLREDSLLCLARFEALGILLMCNAGTLQLRLAISSGWHTRAQARSATSPAAATWAHASLCRARPRRRSPACVQPPSPVLYRRCHGLIIDWMHPHHVLVSPPRCPSNWGLCGVSALGRWLYCQNLVSTSDHWHAKKCGKLDGIHDGGPLTAGGRPGGQGGVVPALCADQRCGPAQDPQEA